MYIINEDIESIPTVTAPENNLYEQPLNIGKAGQIINVYHMFNIMENIKNPSQHVINNLLNHEDLEEGNYNSDETNYDEKVKRMKD